jgi:hypothetical protein
MNTQRLPVRTTLLAGILGVALASFGVLGWTAPAEAYSDTQYAINCPGNILEDGSNLWVSCGSQHRIKQVAKSNGAVLADIALTSDVDPGEMVKIGTTIWAVDTNATGGGQLVKISGGVPTYYPISGKQGQRIATDGTYIYVNGFNDRPTPQPDDNWLYKVNQSGTVLLSNVLGSIFCSGVPCEWDNVKKIVVESTIYGEPVVWTLMNESDDSTSSAVYFGFRTSTLASIRYCSVGGPLDSATLVGTRFDSVGRYGTSDEIWRVDPVACVATLADNGPSSSRQILWDGSQSFVLTTDATNHVSLGRIGAYRSDNYYYSSFFVEPTRVDPKDFIKTGNTFWVSLVGGNLIKYDFSQESALVISGLTATPGVHDATIAWSTAPNNSDKWTEWGLTSSYTSWVGGDTFPPGTAAHSQFINSLNPGTIYHYRVTSCNGYVCVNSGDRQFTTIALALPTVNIVTPVDNGEWTNGAGIPSGTAADSDGTVSLVQIRRCKPACGGGDAWVDATRVGGVWTSWTNTLSFNGYGQYTFEARSKDNDNQYSSVDSVIGFWVALPVVDITSHTNGQVVTNPSITVSGTATDADDQITNPMRLILNGTPQNITITPGQNVNWSKAITLVAGSNTIRVEGTDQRGHIAFEEIIVTLNAQPPVVNITSHTDGQHVTVPNITVSGNATDPDDNITNPMRLYLNADPVQNITITPSQNVNWSKAITLVAGSNTIRVEATDVGGHIGSRQIIVIYDVPDYNFTLTSTTPVTVSQGTNATYTLNLTAINGWNQAVGYVMDQCDGIPCSGGNNKFSFNPASPQTPPGAPGTNITLTVTTSGVASNTYNLRAKSFRNSNPTQNVKYVTFQLIITDGPDFAFSPTGGTQTILPGQNAVYPLHLQQTAPTYSYDVTLTRGTITRPTGGVDAMITGTTFNPTSVRPSPPGPGTGNSQLTITTRGDITPGNWTIQIVGTGDDPNGRIRYYTATLVVSTPNFAIDAYKQGDSPNETVTVQVGQNAVWDVKLDSLNGWGGDIDLWSPTHPAALNGKFSFIPPKGGTPEHGLATLPGGGTVTAQMIINTTGLPPGQYSNITVRGKWDGGATPQNDDTLLILVVTDGPDYDFTPPPLPTTQNGTIGGSVDYTLNLKETVTDYIWPANVTLDSVSPIGGQGKLTTTSLPASVTPGDIAGAPATKQVTIAIAADTPIDTYTLTFKGVGTDSLVRTHFISVQLVLEDVDFALTALPASLSGNPGDVFQYTLNLRDIPDDTDLDYTWTIDLTYQESQPLSGSIFASNLPVARNASEEPGTNYVANIQTSGAARDLYTLRFRGRGGDPTHKQHEVTVQLDLRLIDNTPPVIPPSSITCTPGTDRITVAWTTDEPATGRLYHGTSTPPGTLVNETGGLKTNHSIVASGLTPDTVYYYQVQSCDGVPNCSERLPSPPGTCRTQIVVDNQPPTVNWVEPLNGDNVSGSVPLWVTATDNVAVTDVAFFVDGNLVHTDPAPPACSPQYCFPSWNSTSVANGDHNLTATAHDSSGNPASATITITVQNDSSDPICSNIWYEGQGNEMVITWSTNENADSRVYYCREGGFESCGNCGGDGYGPDQYYCLAEIDSADVQSHQITLDNLDHGATYHFMAESCDAGDNCGICTP